MFRPQEPEDFRPVTPPPMIRTYARRKFGGVGDVAGPAEVEVGLVSGHPLWGEQPAASSPEFWPPFSAAVR